MPGFMPGIHVIIVIVLDPVKAWMAGTSPP
jgi:hypothetical protein